MGFLIPALAVIGGLVVLGAAVNIIGQVFGPDDTEHRDTAEEFYAKRREGRL